jgi:hypothetical protein
MAGEPGDKTQEREERRREQSVRIWLHNYDLITKTKTEHFKSYMQSWSILATGIVVSGIASIWAFVEGESNTVANAVMCFLPVVGLIWFLLTAHFWSEFLLFNDCLAQMERRMNEVCEGAPGMSSDFFSGYVQPFAKSSIYRLHVFLAISLCFLVYVALAIMASLFLADVMGRPFYIWLAGYLAAVAVTVTIILRFMFVASRIREKGEDPEDPGTDKSFFEWLGGYLSFWRAALTKKAKT